MRDGYSVRRASTGSIEAARRAQIVECAIRAIATLGYGQASLAQIAKLAGVSKGVISYHFADKDELIEHVLREVLSEFEAYMRPRIQAQQDAALMRLVEKKVGRDRVIALVSTVIPKALSEVPMNAPTPWSERGDDYERIRQELLALLE